VDATPGVFDVDLNRTNGNTTGSPNWHTLLIGGLGKGGTSFYALDVTNPAGMTSETAVAGSVLWEFTDSTMGYSYGTPVVVKTAQYGWVVVLTSGYNNSDGYGYIYLVNPANGTLLQKIKTPSPSSGLAQASAYVIDYTDYTADSVYVGDLNGQLWRFNLTAATGTYPAPTQIAALADGSGNAQPVTSAPDIEIHPTTRERYVLVGTGQLLSSGDIGSTQTQTFYAIIDGTAGGFSAISTPITRSNLTQVTDITALTVIPPTSKGWYYDLPAGYRVISMPVSYNGIVAFSALEPTTDPCSPQGSSNVYAVNYATGQSVINSTTGGTTPAVDMTFPSAVTNLRIVETNGGTPELIAGTTTGSLSQVNANLTGTLSTRLLNWREVPTAE
jgi:type IV pilus assembly protein PilY1